VHGGDRIAEVLRAQGVPFVFTLCGGHISPILVAAKARGVRVVDVRHEATAVFAADAVARLTGRAGVAAVTAGPGVTNTITAVKNAQLAQSPLVLLVGATATALKGRGALQDIDQTALLRPHVKATLRARRVRELAPLMERAFVEASSGVPGPVSLECPVDLLYDQELVRGWYGGRSSSGGTAADRLLRWYLSRHVNKLFAGAEAPHEPAASQAQVQEPDAGAVERVLSRLRKAERPVVIVGSQATLVADEVPEVAAALDGIGAPVYLAGMARGLLGRSHRLQLRHRRREALKQADLVLLAGVPCDFRLDYGRQIRRGACLVAANRSAADLKLNRRPDIGVRGDAGRFLQKLGKAKGAGFKEDWQPWLEHLRARDDEREGEIDAQTAQPAEPINPLALCAGLEHELPGDSVLVADGGDFVATASYVVRPRAPLCWLDPGAFGTLGVGAGFALGAKLCRPSAEVWLLWGDGSAGYGLVEFDTFVRHDVPVLALVGNDAGWAQIAREQVEILKDDVACTLARSDYHRVAEALGGAGFLLNDADAIGDVLRRARAAAARGRPTLINAHLGATDFRRGSISI